MNIAHLLRDSFRDKSKVRLLGELTNEKTLFLSLTETFLNNNIVDPTIGNTRVSVDGRKVGHFLITIQKSFKLIIN